MSKGIALTSCSEYSMLLNVDRISFRSPAASADFFDPSDPLAFTADVELSDVELSGLAGSSPAPPPCIVRFRSSAVSFSMARMSCKKMIWCSVYQETTEMLDKKKKGVDKKRKRDKQGEVSLVKIPCMCVRITYIYPR